MNPGPSGRGRRGWTLIGADVLICLAWAGSVWAALHLEPGPGIRTVALFAHLGALVIGLGAVLTIDYYGTLWLLGRRSLHQVLEFAGPLHVPVWAGLAGLVLSGAALDPDPRVPLTQVKLVLVLLIALNGVHAQVLHRTMVDQAGTRPSRRLLGRAVISAVVSQLGWWGALTIGFLNSQS
ncbi:hypothetical protein STRCI_007165 [Streptomyces cinnabarinus]|uniref:Copper resistance protein D domain-containing protein n=1 Tax=Streptomyces cinnabarinus TaxID=67287 RepID=A0ABY7KPZ1_9ACTN|nr:hypothetical protein [Streptomyces cinnabarinus]WAZ25655.1 hypothetical protein STRCI_007165 [Streptomyces cinnabarinus]